MKILYTMSLVLVTYNALAQNSARAMGNSLGKFIAGFLIAFLLYRFVVRPLLNKNKTGQ